MGLITPSNMEINPDINRYSHIILGWNILNWALESNTVLGDHDCHSFIVAVTASEAWCHYSLVNSTTLLKNVHSVWDIDFSVTAGRIIDQHH